MTTEVEIPSKSVETDETEELAKLRCTSVCTEVIAEREMAKKRRQEGRQKKCPDYPGFAFGSIFGSDTMLKFNVIKNDLQNIRNSQLRRVDGEVAALIKRIKCLDENLQKSEEYLMNANKALQEALELMSAEERETRDGIFDRVDQQVARLETKLLHTRLLAREANIRYGQTCTDLDDLLSDKHVSDPSGGPALIPSFDLSPSDVMRLPDPNGNEEVDAGPDERDILNCNFAADSHEVSSESSSSPTPVTTMGRTIFRKSTSPDDVTNSNSDIYAFKKVTGSVGSFEVT